VAVCGVELKSKSQLQQQNGAEVSGRLVRLLLIALSEAQMYNPTLIKAADSHSLKTHDSEALSQRMNKAFGRNLAKQTAGILAFEHECFCCSLHPLSY
jgi:hypothetical protein